MSPFTCGFNQRINDLFLFNSTQHETFQLPVLRGVTVSHKKEQNQNPSLESILLL